MDNTLVAILYGLAGAIGWGVSNFFAAKSTNENSALNIVFNSQLLIFIIMTVVILVSRPEMNITLGFLGFFALVYIAITLALVLSYKAYSIGPLSITSPIVGANSLIVVIISVLLFNEVLQPNQWAGILILLTGLTMAVRSKPNHSKNNSSKRGIYLASISMVLFGLGISGFIYGVEKVGWMPAVWLGYFFPALWTGLFLVYKKQFKKPRFNKNLVYLSLFNVFGTIAVSVGVETSLSAIIIPVSAISLLITSFLGLYIFREKISKFQLSGVLTLFFGLILILI